ncbi:MAG: serine/threonine-protein kinase [Mycobacterium sp.]
MTWAASGDAIANRYRLTQFLGRGTFGEVWRATDTYRNHDVALKLILSRDRAATWHEASVLTALRSEHILEVNNADVYVDLPYLDTALAACSLDSRTEPFGIEPRVAVDWMRRALRGLDLCHRRGLLHRDIKPHNIFLTSGGDAKLGDFGVAAFMDAAGTADAHGDMRIRAPELLAGGRASVASDIYSAACTLYALVVGQLPFAGITQQSDLVAAVTQGNYVAVRDRAPHVSMALAEKIRTGMDLDPSRRFQSAAAFDNALALPKRSRHFTPGPPHQGHLRCWRATGFGRDIDVCVLDSTRPNRILVETRYRPSGTRLKRHCFESTARDLARRLRAVFQELRDA